MDEKWWQWDEHLIEWINQSIKWMRNDDNDINRFNLTNDWMNEWMDEKLWQWDDQIWMNEWMQNDDLMSWTDLI